MPKSIFTHYWAEVSRILGGKPNKGSAIYLSEHPAMKFDGVLVVDKLYKSLDCSGWENSKGRNWEWRREAPTYRTASPEVSLEREIIASDEKGQWSCQMSTTSGVQGPYLNKRRAIDLVLRKGADHYAFIELKVDGDNPLYAAFEILGYGLAYLHGRRHGWKGKGTYDVMDAREVDLVVLGPHEWWTYKRRRGIPERKSYHLRQHFQQLSKGLDALTEGTPRMKLSAEAFEYRTVARETAVGIVNKEYE